ncbi:hypothetical protein LIA77_03204 [Sarocladium implicatum]|nr:hypothetical protein LIA77_03204 [Sarocladium implicatum]
MMLEKNKSRAQGGGRDVVILSHLKGFAFCKGEVYGRGSLPRYALLGLLTYKSTSYELLTPQGLQGCKTGSRKSVTIVKVTSITSPDSGWSLQGCASFSELHVAVMARLGQYCCHSRHEYSFVGLSRDEAPWLSQGIHHEHR